MFASQHLVDSTKHKVQLKLLGMSLVLQLFGQKPKYWTNKISELMMVLGEI